MKIRNVDFDFNPFNARHADKLTHATAALQEAHAAAQQSDHSNLGAVIRAQCAAIDAFLAELLGEDYDERLGIDIDDLLELKRVSKEVMDQITAAKREMEDFAQQDPVAEPAAEQPASGAAGFAGMNRAQRRAAVRAIRDGNA